MVRGGVKAYSLKSKRPSLKYSFVARDKLPVISDIDTEEAIDTLYGELTEVEIVDDGEDITVFSDVGVGDASIELAVENEVNTETNADDRQDQAPVPTNFLANNVANIKDSVITPVSSKDEIQRAEMRRSQRLKDEVKMGTYAKPFAINS